MKKPKRINMLLDKGKVYFEADSLSEWLLDAIHPVIRNLGKGLKIHADEAKKQIQKESQNTIHES